MTTEASATMAAIERRIIELRLEHRAQRRQQSANVGAGEAQPLQIGGIIAFGFMAAYSRWTTATMASCSSVTLYCLSERISGMVQ